MGEKMAKKKKVSGSLKGFPYERKMAKVLSLWWTDGLNQDIFWRTAGSGGRATNRKKLTGEALKYSYGDIGFLDPIGKPFIDFFLLELKKGYTKDIDPLSIVDSKKKKHLLFEWWDKAEIERQESERKKSLIIFERDRHKSCVMIDFHFMSKLIDYYGTFQHSTLTIERNTDCYLSIVSFNDFFNWFDPEYVKEHLHES